MSAPFLLSTLPVQTEEMINVIVVVCKMMTMMHEKTRSSYINPADRDDAVTAFASLPPEFQKTLRTLMPEAFEHIRHGMDARHAYEKLTLDHPEAKDALDALGSAAGTQD